MANDNDGKEVFQQRIITQNNGVTNRDIFGGEDRGFFAVVQLGPFDHIDHATQMSEIMTRDIKDGLTRRTGEGPLNERKNHH